eukprot:GFUD01014155.1.p1 GENE.GFUD01014155.1~~GFUD01014155.1.p1  ORF type:complete len:506 (-),score=179.88 GFUD01014155.1:83-1600(-)
MTDMVNTREKMVDKYTVPNSQMEKVLDCLLYSLSLLYIAACPFTKVEESYNLQAMHDLLHHGADVDQYDHHTFPGVVPRTFLGPLCVAIISFPLTSLVTLLGGSKFIHQLIVRAVLTCLVLGSFRVYRSAVRNRFGTQVSTWLTLLTMSQFHFLFYSSRPLPNTMALVPVLLSLSFWLNSNPTMFIFTAASSILIFRGELAMFLGAVLLMELVVGKVSLLRVLVVGLVSLLVWIPLTVAVDSFFWGRLLWPEAEVMYFNLVLNKSSDWGVQPLLWYFYSALPRALGSSLLLLPLAPILDRRTIILLFPCITFISLYSLLPHKELRFIIYTFPVLNTAAGATAARLWINRSKSSLSRLISLALLGHLVLNLLASSTLLYVSSLNYPGGQAIRTLHQLEVSTTPHLSVHLDVLACQTGVTRFTQEVPDWVYDKTEDLSDEELGRFSHLVVAGQHRYTLHLKHFLKTHKFIGQVDSFSGLRFNYTNFPPVEVESKPALYILKKIKDDS